MASVWSGWMPRLVLAVALVVVGVVAVGTLDGPSARSANAPASEFSAARALEDLEVIASDPRPHGSDGNRRAREHIVDVAGALGLDGVVVPEVGADNIVVELDGADPTGAVLVTAHYDSVPVAPGAGDAGVSVVALLESMRVLAAQPPLRNDVIFLFSDGEESGWSGSEAFTRSALAEDVGVVIAMESEPGNGPTTLQQTSAGDGWLVRALAKVDPPVWASSSWIEPERDDFDSDFDVLSAAGLPGVEFANPKDGTRYHTSRDTIDAVDASLVQSHGETVVGLARHFGNLDLDAQRGGGDRALVTVPGFGLVSYPSGISDGLAVLALVIVAALIAAALLQHRTTPSRLGLSVGFALGVLIAVTAVAAASWDAVAGRLAPDDVVDFVDFDGSALAMTLVLAVAGCVIIGATGLWISRRGAIDVLLAAVAVLTIAHILFLISQRLALPATTWPLLALCGAVTAWMFAPPSWRLLVLVVAAVPALVLLLPQLALWVDSPSEGAALPVAITALLLASLAPQLVTLAGRSAGSEIHQSAAPAHDDAPAARPDDMTVAGHAASSRTRA